MTDNIAANSIIWNADMVCLLSVNFACVTDSRSGPADRYVETNGRTLLKAISNRRLAELIREMSDANQFLLRLWASMNAAH